MKKCVAAAVASCSLWSLPAGASAVLLGTQPPAGAQKAALTKAFWRAHRGQKAKLKLVGFRIWENRPAAAAYFLSRAPGGGYAQGGQEYYKRTGGGRYVRVSRVPAMDADNLAAAYLFAIHSTGSGTQTDASNVTRPDDTAPTGSDVETTTTTQHFTWSLAYGPHGGLPLELGDPGGATAGNGMTGTIAYTSTSSDDPTLSYTCAGNFHFTGQGPGMTETEKRSRHAWDFGVLLGGEQVSGGSNVVGTPPAPSPYCPSAGIDPERLVGTVRVRDSRFEPLSRSASHVTSFSLPFNSANPSLAKTVLPHQSSTMTDFDGTVTTGSQDLSFSGTLSFTLTGMMLPHGLLGAPDRPPYQG